MTGDASRSRHKRYAVENPDRRVVTEKNGCPSELPSLPHFQAVTGQAPYPWQRRLYRRFLRGEVPHALDIPTGLGKTTSVLVALLARLVKPE